MDSRPIVKRPLPVDLANLPDNKSIFLGYRMVEPGTWSVRGLNLDRCFQRTVDPELWNIF
jgi:hypothetical protein